MAKKKNKKNPDEVIQDSIANIVVNSEYRTAVSNQSSDNLDFESLVDILEGKRNEKSYEWMSDYSIPELVSIIQTNASGWAGQYFPTRDFVEVKLGGDKTEDTDKARAVKKLINKILNDRELYYYQKYIRLRLINALHGRCYVICWWDQKLKKQKVTVQRPKKLNVDMQGNPITDPTTQQPRIIMVPVEIEVERPVIDRFDFEVLDPRNVFMDNKYCYTAQQKDWIIVRSETTYENLKADEVKNRYFNLDKVKEACKSKNQPTDTEKETYGKNESGTTYDKTPVTYFDIIDRYGTFWANVQDRDSNGNPLKATPGLGEDGMPTEKAELVEMIITYAMIGNTNIMVRFEPTQNISASGKPFKPIVRGLCYVHPVKDNGLSDGKNMKELQIAIDDNFNMGSDRVKLATLPTFKGKKTSLDDNSTVYFEPEHVIELESPDDLQEVVIRDNIQGAMAIHSMLTSKIQQVSATFPTTMGAGFDKSATATEVAGTENRTNQRENYKSLTFEYTFLVNFYWTIIQMANRYAHDETLIKLMGEDVKFFDADADYSYSPLSSNIEQEYNKYKKIQLYDQSIGRISGMVQALPQVVPIIAHMIGRQLELQGDEFQVIGKMIADLAQSKPKPEGGQPDQVKDGNPPPESNQNGVEMSTMEADARSSQMNGGMVQ